MSRPSRFPAWLDEQRIDALKLPAAGIVYLLIVLFLVWLIDSSAFK